jgi:hypothetical protein
MSSEPLLQILDLARWAPSGDNTQPWRFEIIDGSRIAIHGYDTREHVLYDFDGRPSHMAHGALVETLRLAATRYGFDTEWEIRSGCSDTKPVYDITLHRADVSEDPLVPFIETRTVQRRAMKTTPLRLEQKEALIDAVGDKFSLQFFETFTERLAFAHMLWNSAHIRLICPEAYPVHRDIIEWNARYSADRIPEQAVGVDPLTARIMRWVMGDWERVRFFNRYLGGTILPRVQLDFLPALACASHVLLKPNGVESGLIGHLRAGIALQRLWLTASRLGLHLQPEMTPLIFRWYVQAGRKISSTQGVDDAAVRLARQFERLTSAQPVDNFAFLCRVGFSRRPYSRSLRKELSTLIDQGRSSSPAK